MKEIIISIRAFVLLTLLTGAIYPLAVTVMGQMVFPGKATGSLMKNRKGEVIGSELIAQEFKTDRYFWPRPSAVGYNPLPSGGSNLGPTSKALQEKWEERRKLGFNGDMLAASASGLDPHISPDSAYRQMPRVAKARGRGEEEVRKIIEETVERRELGFLGEPKVNVVRLNLVLDQRM